jgi:hypothetical protein
VAALLRHEGSFFEIAPVSQRCYHLWLSITGHPPARNDPAPVAIAGA